MERIPTPEDLRKTWERVRPWINRTPVMTSSTLDRMLDTSLFFKCENFQKVGAFKFRGASNAVLCMPEEDLKKGVATHSSGNHAQALALAARKMGVPAYIVMPSNSPEVKQAAVRGYGAEVILCEPTLQAREATLNAVVERTGATFVHPYNNYDIIAGQSTAAQELIQDYPDLDIILAPVGGGGLMSGTALAARYFSPGTQVIGAEPAGANDAYRSFQTGTLIPSVNPKTIGDGLLTSLGEKTFEIILNHVDDIVTCSEQGILQAMRLIWERMKILVEPSSAVPLATLLENKIDVRGKRVGIIISGGNVDMGVFFASLKAKIG